MIPVVYKSANTGVLLHKIALARALSKNLEGTLHKYIIQ